MIQQILMRRVKLVSAVLILVAAPSLLVGQVTGESAPGSAGQALATKEFVLKGTDGWTDTELVLKPGQHIAVTAGGRLQYADAQITNGPDGLNRGFKDLLRILPFNGAGRGALIARVGDADYAQPFLLGSHKDVVSPVGGKLWIGINQSARDTGEGSYEVKLKIFPAEATGSWGLARPVDNIPGVDDPTLG